MALRVFPVQGGASYRAEYYPVATPAQRQHLGIDLFAPHGTPLLAVDDGLASLGTDPLGGNVVNLRSADGTRYYYAHLASFVGGYQPGLTVQVRAGDVIGYVGTTGNARTTSPHSHFEVHPPGAAGPRGTVDPYPLLRAAPVRRDEPRPLDGVPFARTVVSLVVAVALGGAAWWGASALQPRLRRGEPRLARRGAA